MTADVIDLLAGIEPGSGLDRLRGLRAQARENAQLSFEALLEPAAPGEFPLSERYAVAAFVALLHGFDGAAEFYADLLGDEAPELVEGVRAAATGAAGVGPTGVYREPGLSAESRIARHWTASADVFGARLGAALTHAHLLVLRPREADASAIRTLVEAGWSADDVVTLSQLVAFLTFQLRLAWGLRVLREHPAPEAASEPRAAETEGALR